MIRAAFLVLAACGNYPAIPDGSPLPLMPAPDVYDVTAAVVEAINVAAEREIVFIGSRPGDTMWIYEACGSIDGNQIRVSPGCDDDATVQGVILVHEIGHALGLQHVDDPASIMFARFHRMTIESAAASLVEELRQ